MDSFIASWFLEVRKMDNSPTPKFKCPSCGELNSQVAAADEFSCQSCNQLFKLSGHYCPECFEYSEENRASCANCGEILIRSCPKCGRENWSGRHNCRYCGQSLDLFTTVADRYSTTAPADRFQARMQRAKTIRTIDEVASSSRMEELNLAEEVRRSGVMDQERRSRQRDRQLLIAAGAVLLLFLLAIIIFSLII